MSSVIETQDFSQSIGAFLMVTRDGKLDAIDSVRVSGSGVELAKAGLDLSILSPLVSKIRRSNLSIALRGGEPPKTQFNMRVTVGSSTRLMNAPGSKTDFISRALDDASLPIIVESELEKRVSEHLQKDAESALHVPLRSLKVREHLPRDIEQLLRDLAISNAIAQAPKAKGLAEGLKAIRRGLRNTVLHDYMMKCVWLNPETGQLGNIIESSGSLQFLAFDPDHPDVSAFLCALEKNPFGDFVLDFREFANVEPTPKRGNPWLGPSVHIYKDEFRKEHSVDEYYSLYAGFRALSTIGAPVLIYKGQNPLIERTEIRFVKVTDRSINLLQGRILEGNLLQEGVREFTAQALVWKN